MEPTNNAMMVVNIQLYSDKFRILLRFDGEKRDLQLIDLICRIANTVGVGAKISF
jgi:hypothetical protein